VYFINRRIVPAKVVRQGRVYACLDSLPVTVLLYEDYVWVSLGNTMKAKQRKAKSHLPLDPLILALICFAITISTDKRSWHAYTLPSSCLTVICHAITGSPAGSLRQLRLQVALFLFFVLSLTTIAELPVHFLKGPTLLLSNTPSLMSW
jgi:hypothetical protein